MSEVGWGRPHTSSDSDCNPSRNSPSDSNGMRGKSPGQRRNPIVSEGEFRLGLQSESELVWGRPHPTSDMDTESELEVAYKSPGQLPVNAKSHCLRRGVPTRIAIRVGTRLGFHCSDFTKWKFGFC